MIGSELSSGGLSTTSAWYYRLGRAAFAGLDSGALWGYYHDTIVRDRGGWRMATRQLRVLAVEGWDVEWYPATEER